MGVSFLGTAKSISTHSSVVHLPKFFYAPVSSVLSVLVSFYLFKKQSFYISCSGFQEGAKLDVWVQFSILTWKKEKTILVTLGSYYLLTFLSL